MNTEATEYSKSGTDDASARQEEAAFDPNLTSPESQHEKAAEGQGVSDTSKVGHSMGIEAADTFSGIAGIESARG